MNKWQKAFLGFGVLASLIVCVFPPQLMSSHTVRFLPVTYAINYGYPIDWFRLFIWLVAIIFVTALGIAANKGEHF